MANMRITGMISGFDTDSMIKDLMKAESAKTDKVKKDKQYTIWQRDGFREIINKLRSFQSNYFDVLKSGQNMSSATSFAKFNYSVTSDGVPSSKLTVTASAGLKSKEVTIDSIDQLATKDSWIGDVANLRGIDSVSIDNTFSGKISGNLEFTLAVGTNAQLISLTQAEISNDPEQLKIKIQEKITAAFGNDYNNIVSLDGTKIEFDMAGTDLKIMQYNGNSESMNALFGSDATKTSNDYKSKTVGDLFGLDNTTLANVVINGKTIVLDSGDTIAKMIEKVNASDANVTLNFDTLRDKFTLTSKTEGSASNIKITDGSNAEVLFSKLFGVSDVNGIVDAAGNPIVQVPVPPALPVGLQRNEGLNAKVTINGVSVTQPNNTFSLDGMTYSLKATSDVAINIKAETDTTTIISNIKNFVKDYNEIIDYISTKLSEKRDYDYSPLTDDEREALSDDEVKLYETKAKSGILRGSSELTGMLQQLRNAVIEPIEGVGLSMSQIGISSVSYLDKGKLTIDETKLKSAIENNYDEVVKLFTKESTTSYSNTSSRATRDSENGIASRFNDILKDNIRVTRDNNGVKGKLIVKAGIENDTSQFINDFQKKIAAFDDRISDLLDYLSNRESYYYTMFSKMEAAMSQMQSQSSSLMSQLGA
jgi:flagellar hook-associated protein 2